jgi:AbrB family looped-hinge helix DNA binding protein
MNTSTISSKYQIVIPKALRNKMALQPGQRVVMREGKKGEIIVDTTSAAAAVAGKYTGLWGGDSSHYVRELRDEWEVHQSELDQKAKGIADKNDPSH